jgi:hypothetical protein
MRGTLVLKQSLEVQREGVLAALDWNEDARQVMWIVLSSFNYVKYQSYLSAHIFYAAGVS